ncbi:hypothetical protein [Nonomuraea sp. NPDC050310]|uniref:hypothetical protein n=1 Tax=Nonomuraea sp. NPDC050310 TaxID=3154935 RepID=UPI0033CFCA1D
MDTTSDQAVPPAPIPPVTRPGEPEDVAGGERVGAGDSSDDRLAAYRAARERPEPALLLGPPWRWRANVRAWREARLAHDLGVTQAALDLRLGGLPEAEQARLRATTQECTRVAAAYESRHVVFGEVYYRLLMTDARLITWLAAGALIPALWPPWPGWAAFAGGIALFLVALFLTALAVVWIEDRRRQWSARTAEAVLFAVLAVGVYWIYDPAAAPAWPGHRILLTVVVPLGTLLVLAYLQFAAERALRSVSWRLKERRHPEEALVDDLVWLQERCALIEAGPEEHQGTPVLGPPGIKLSSRIWLANYVEHTARAFRRCGERARATDSGVLAESDRRRVARISAAVRSRQRALLRGEITADELGTHFFTVLRRLVLHDDPFHDQEPDEAPGRPTLREQARRLRRAPLVVLGLMLIGWGVWGALVKVLDTEIVAIAITGGAGLLALPLQTGPDGGHSPDGGRATGSRGLRDRLGSHTEGASGRSRPS